MKKIFIIVLAMFLLVSCTNSDSKSVDDLRDEYGMTSTSTEIQFIIEDENKNVLFGKEASGYNLISIQPSESGSEEAVFDEIEVGDKIKFDTIKSYDSRVKNIDIDGKRYSYITYLGCENFEILK